MDFKMGNRILKLLEEGSKTSGFVIIIKDSRKYSDQELDTIADIYFKDKSATDWDDDFPGAGMYGYRITVHKKQTYQKLITYLKGLKSEFETYSVQLGKPTKKLKWKQCSDEQKIIRIWSQSGTFPVDDSDTLEDFKIKVFKHRVFMQSQFYERDIIASEFPYREIKEFNAFKKLVKNSL